MTLKVRPDRSYVLTTISMYPQDDELLNRIVSELKAKGFHKANRSAVIRYALTLVNVDKVPKGL